MNDKDYEDLSAEINKFLDARADRRVNKQFTMEDLKNIKDMLQGIPYGQEKKDLFQVTTDRERTKYIEDLKNAYSDLTLKLVAGKNVSFPSTMTLLYMFTALMTSEMIAFAGRDPISQLELVSKMVSNIVVTIKTCLDQIDPMLRDVAKETCGTMIKMMLEDKNMNAEIEKLMRDAFDETRKGNK